MSSRKNDALEARGQKRTAETGTSRCARTSHVKSPLDQKPTTGMYFLQMREKDRTIQNQSTLQEERLVCHEPQSLRTVSPQAAQALRPRVLATFIHVQASFTATPQGYGIATGPSVVAPAVVAVSGFASDVSPTILYEEGSPLAASSFLPSS